MKKVKRILSLVLAVCSIMSLMAVSTFASGPQDGVITCQILTDSEVAKVCSVRTTTTGTAYLPKSDHNGTKGNPCAPFVAEDTDVGFVITSAPGATTYNVQLYAGTPGSGYKVAEYNGRLPIGNGAYFIKLTVGQSYYFMISSSDITTSGCTVTYQLVV